MKLRLDAVDVGRVSMDTGPQVDAVLDCIRMSLRRVFTWL